MTHFEGAGAAHTRHLQFCLGLERKVHCYDKWVLDSSQNFTLRACMLNLAAALNKVFLQHLHGLDRPSVVSALHQEYFTKRPLSNHSKHLKVFQRHS